MGKISILLLVIIWACVVAGGCGEKQQPIVVDGIDLKSISDSDLKASIQKNPSRYLVLRGILKDVKYDAKSDGGIFSNTTRTIIVFMEDGREVALNLGYGPFPAVIFSREKENLIVYNKGRESIDYVGTVSR